ncbi:MAG TPA: hypothetical protein VGC95_08060, partial [Chitinophagaceae bacterium]
MLFRKFTIGYGEKKYQILLIGRLLKAFESTVLILLAGRRSRTIPPSSAFNLDKKTWARVPL